MCRHEPLNVCHLSVNACLINALLSFVVFWLLNKIHKLFSTFNVCFGRHKMTVFGKWHAKSATSNRPWVVKVWALVRPAFCLRWGLGSSRGHDSQVPLNCSSMLFEHKLWVWRIVKSMCKELWWFNYAGAIKCCKNAPKLYLMVNKEQI